MKSILAMRLIITLGRLLTVTGFSFALTIPTPVSYVTDQANIIDDTVQSKLESKIDALEKTTTDEIAILTLPDLEGEDISQLGTEVAQKRGIGKDKEDNGILIIVAPHERQRRIDVGYGLEATIPDAIAVRLGSQILPDYFRQEQYGEGLLQLTDKLIAILEGREDIPQSIQDTSQDTNWFGYMLLMTALIMIMSSTLKKNLNKNIQKGMAAIGGALTMTIIGIIIFGMGLIAVFLLRFLIRRLIGLFGKPGLGGTGRYRTPGGGFGGFGGGSFGGGFGGFGGGSFGGGGASGSR